MRNLKVRLEKLESVIEPVVVKEDKPYTSADWTSEERRKVISCFRSDTPVPEELFQKVKLTNWGNRTVGMTQAEREALLKQLREIDDDPMDDLTNIVDAEFSLP